MINIETIKLRKLLLEKAIKLYKLSVSITKLVIQETLLKTKQKKSLLDNLNCLHW